ncbi:MAG: sulfurtransferase, partial [Candidatus Dormibacteria bacterium]
DLAGPAGPAGRHPLPSPDQFAKAMRRAGVDEDSTVVAYDGGTGAAARAWWLLHASGHVRAAVLDGGWDGWRGRGHPTVMGEEASRGGTFRAHDFEGWVGADELAALLRRGEVVLDARSHERYLGQPSPLDPRPGHVPGATNLPWSDAYARGLVRSADELSRLLRDAGRGRVPAAAYCGSGVTACSLILALASAGVEGVRLYPGSWSEWAQDPGRPAETGEGVSRGG